MPCREEYPHLETFYQKYQDQGFKIISISGDHEGEDAGKYARDVGATFPVIHDVSSLRSDGPQSQIFPLYGVGPIPTSVTIDRTGVVRRIESGFPGVEALEAKILEIVED